MPGERQVVVTYPADKESAAVIAATLGSDAEPVFLHGLPEARRAAVLSRAVALIGWNPSRELPRGALDDAPELRFIQLLSAGADSVDFRAIPGHVMVAGNVGAYAAPMAEHVLAMALALARRLPQRHAELARGEFNQREPLMTLDGAVCAILGFGGIGSATASLMRACGASIHAVNTSGRTSEPVDFAATLADLDQVLAAADVLVIALPLTRTTRGLIGARELSLMKPGAILINVARGAIVDERALYEHLVASPAFSAGIDAWWHEPPADSPFRTDFPFFELPNVLGSPHDSAIVPGVLRAGVARAAANVRRFLRGDPVTGLMRPQDYE